MGPESFSITVPRYPVILKKINAGHLDFSTINQATAWASAAKVNLRITLHQREILAQRMRTGRNIGFTFAKGRGSPAMTRSRNGPTRR